MGGALGHRRGGREGDQGEFFNLAVCQSPTSYNSAGHPHQRGVACVIWLNQGWAVAAGSWVLTTVSSSSSLNYEGWAKAASLITVSDCPSVGVSQTAIAACAWYEEKKGPFLIGLPNSFSAWEQRENMIRLVGEKRDVSWFGKSEPMQNQRGVRLHWWCHVCSYQSFQRKWQKP